MPILVATRSMAWVIRRLPAGIEVSNPADGRDIRISLLGVLCVVEVEVSATGRSLVRRKSYLVCACVCVCVCVSNCRRSRNLNIARTRPTRAVET